MKRKWGTALAILAVALIWGQSLLPAGLSGAESGWVTALLKRIAEGLGLRPLTGHTVRKLAHVTEFLALGLMLGTLWKGQRLKGLYACFTVAFLDETLQLLSGRGARVQDVWIDLLGAGLGLALAWLVHGIRGRRKGLNEG